MLTLRCAPRARLAVVPRRCSHRRTVEEKIEDLGGTVIDTSNQKSLVKAVQSRVQPHVHLFPLGAHIYPQRPIEKPHKSELSMKRRRQEMNSSLFQAKNLDELGYVRDRTVSAFLTSHSGLLRLSASATASTKRPMRRSLFALLSLERARLTSLACGTTCATVAS